MLPLMAEETTDLKDQPTASVAGESPDASTISFVERYTEIVAKVNEFLGSVDWQNMGRFGKGAGILIAVIVAQVLIKGVIDAINVLPVLPGVLELIGLVASVQWCFKNLATNEKRTAVVNKVQTARKDYLG